MRKIEDLVLDIQMFMQDYLRAGVTCEAKVPLARDVVEQIKYLDQAKQNFNLALSKQLCRVENSPLTETEVTQKLQNISLQLDALTFFNAQFQSNIPDRILSKSLLDPNNAAFVAEELFMLNNWQLAQTIMNTFARNLDSTSIYSNTITRIAKAKKITYLNDFLRYLKVKNYILKFLF